MIERPWISVSYKSKSAYEKAVLDWAYNNVFDPKRQACIIWSIEDVNGEGSRFKHLTDEQAMEVIERVIHKHDPEYGVCWNTIWDTAGDMFVNEMCTLAFMYDNGTRPRQIFYITIEKQGEEALEARARKQLSIKHGLYPDYLTLWEEEL